MRDASIPFVALMNSSPVSRNSVRWPDAAAALGEVYASEWLRRLKYALRSWMTIRGRRNVLEHVAGSAAAQTLLATSPRAFYPAMRKHLDRRFGTQARARTLVESMRGMERALGPELAQRVFSGDALTLGTLPDATRITLNLNRLTFHEGLWAIDLARDDGLRLFTISFGWLDSVSLMIACVQGPPRDIDGLECVRGLTDAAQGLRPGHLLLFMLRACAQSWGVTRIIGVDEAFQVKGRWNHAALERHFDYKAFWTETSGTVCGDGNWLLPVSVQQRPLEDVPSKRRAMYRRRYGLLDALVESAQAALRG
jgi:uncharacterized protein VirK/YbjX